jgi:FMN phosphatase YigB (HAD superfamily)
MFNNLVFLFDVDNTLLDNDRVSADLKRHLEREVGLERQERYWAIFEELRAELGYADYLGALQLYRSNYPRDPNLLAVSHFLLEYPFANRLFPNALDAVEHVKRFGYPVLLSDGDVVFQPHKIRRAGLHDAFDGAALIYIHKEHELDDVEGRYPADHYVLVDDKIRILTAIKRAWGQRVTTVLPRQGHYALDHTLVDSYPPADYTIDRIGDLVNLDFQALTSAGAKADIGDFARYIEKPGQQ